MAVASRHEKEHNVFSLKSTLKRCSIDGRSAVASDMMAEQGERPDSHPTCGSWCSRLDCGCVLRQPVVHTTTTSDANTQMDFASTPLRGREHAASSGYHERASGAAQTVRTARKVPNFMTPPFSGHPGAGLVSEADTWDASKFRHPEEKRLNKVNLEVNLSCMVVHARNSTPQE